MNSKPEKHKHKSVDELKIDIDILVLEIGDVRCRKDQLKVLSHLEESLKILKRDSCSAGSELTCDDEEENEALEPRRKRPRISYDETNDDIDEDEDMSENMTSDEFELNNTFHSDDVMPVADPEELAMVKNKSMYYTVEQGVLNCILCDFSTEKLNNMRVHLTRHTSNIKCEVCDVYFTRAVNLKRHQEGVQHKARVMANAGAGDADTDNDETSEPEPLYACPNAPDCVEAFATEQELNCHVETHLYKCQYCEAMFTGDEDRYEHMRNDHDIGGRANKRSRSVMEDADNDPPVWSCEFCQFKTDNEKLLKAHVAKHNYEYECLTCSTSFSSQYNLDMHLDSLLHLEMSQQEQLGMDVHGQVFTCRHCGKTYDRKESFRKHLNLHTDKYKCSHCDRCFREKNKLENHLNNNEKCQQAVTKSNEEDSKDTFPCQLCSKSYSKKEYLTQHMVEHTDKYQCTNCQLSFSNKRRLDTHTRSPGNCAKLLTIRENAKRRQETGFTEGTAPRVKSSRRKSESDAETVRKVKHLRYEDDTPWTARSSPKTLVECPECHQDYASLYNLRRHMDRFHPDYSIPMKEEGPKASLSPGEQEPDELQSPVKEEHRKVDEVEEKQEIEVFHCEECDKFFSSKASLNNHMISHTDKYKCSNCKQGFSCRRYLEQHSRNRNNCDKLLLKKKKESLLNASYIFNPRDFVETIIQGEEIKNNNT